MATATVQLLLDSVAQTKEDVAQALINLKHKSKKIDNQLKELSKSLISLMSGEEDKTLKLHDGQVTVRSSMEETWVSDEVLTAWLKKRRKYSDNLVRVIDYSILTPEFLEAHGLLETVSTLEIDKDSVRESFSDEDLSEIRTITFKETVAVTLTKKKEK